jgi:hypothetical protein
MFLAKEDQMRSPGTLLGPQFLFMLRSSFGPQFVFMLTSSNTLNVVNGNEYIAYFAGSGLQGLNFGPNI